MNALTQTFVVIGLFCALGGQTLTAQTGSTVIATGHPVDENISSSFAAIARRALTGNFDLQSRRTAYEAQVSTIRAVNAGLRPRVDLDMLGGADRSRQVDNTGNSERFSGSSSRATLSLRQPLYDGNAISSEAERQARLGNVQYFELRQAEDVLMVDLTRAWIDATRQRALIQIAQANLVAHERLVGLVQTRVRRASAVGLTLIKPRLVWRRHAWRWHRTKVCLPMRWPDFAAPRLWSRRRNWRRFRFKHQCYRLTNATRLQMRLSARRPCASVRSGRRLSTPNCAAAGRPTHRELRWRAVTI